MSIRNLTLVMLVLVTGSSTGCGGMKNFLFGRGARCGLANRVGAVGNALNPLAPAPGINQAPGFAQSGGCGTPSGCGLFSRNNAPAYAPPVAYAGPTCNESCVGSGYVDGGYIDGGYINGGHSMGTAGACESCNSYGGHYEGVVSDPYLGNPVNGYSDGYSGGYQGDNFYDRNSYQSRRFDSRGDEIISESPLPPGAQIIN